MPLLLLALVALGAFVFGRGAGAAVVESDDAAGDKGPLDAVKDALTGGATQFEAYARGVSLGLIDVSPIGSGYYLRWDAAASWLRLKSAAVAGEVTLQVDSAFRTMAEQSELWARKQAGQLSQLVAFPGTSNHQNGIAIDVAVQARSDSPTYRWLAAHAPAFGWTNTGATFSRPEYWHWEYFPENDLYA